MHPQENFGKLNLKSFILNVSRRVKYLSKIGFFSSRSDEKFPFPTCAFRASTQKLLHQLTKLPFSPDLHNRYKT
jgi:hypothetical protein